MLKTKPWYYNKISTDATLLALVGGVSHISDSRPEVITVFPMVILTDENQEDKEYADNQPSASSQTIKVDVFTKIDSALPTTTAIGARVADIFKALFFHCRTNGETPDPVEGVRHRILRFSRDLFPSDIV